MSLRLRFLCALLCGLTILSATSAYAQVRSWMPDDRVLISDFSAVGGLATDMRQLYAATRNGLEIYDFAARRWQLPSTLEDGYPVDVVPGPLVFERETNSLWLLSANGPVYNHSLDFGRWYPRLSVPDEITQKALAQRRTLNEPYLAAARGTATQDEHLRRWPLTAAQPGEFPGTYWLGTDGGNVMQLDTRRMTSSPLRFGLTAPGVRALAALKNGIWFGNDGRSPRSGVAFATRDLQQWKTYERIDGAPSGEVRQIVVRGDTVWFAASDGLYRFDGRRFETLTSDDVTSVAWFDNDMYVGTAKGLVKPGGVTDVSLGRVNSMFADSSGLWIGADEGSFAIGRTDSITRRGLGITILDLITHQGESYVLSQQYMMQQGATVKPQEFPPNARGMTEFLPVRVVTSQIGTAFRFRADGARLWVAGTRGAGVLDNGNWTFLTVPADIPIGPVLDVQPDGEFVWFATPAGALRVRWGKR